MRHDAPMLRREVFLAIDTLQKLDGEAKRPEIAEVSGVFNKDLELAINWLQRKRMIERQEGGNWILAIYPNVESFCWIHGNDSPCKSCKRSIYGNLGTRASARS